MLRGMGFTVAFDSMAGGGRTVQWFKIVRDRTVEVQLSDDGNHRASHFLGARMSTPPIYFTTPDDMICAIANELMRTDHAPRL